MLDIKIEACVESVESAVEAQGLGAHGVELCAALDIGGTTPARDTIARARERLKIGLFVLIRPRGGDFVYTSDEYETMAREVLAAKALGADGVVVGGLTDRGAVDQEGVRRLLEAAQPLPVTFHRAFDASRDLDAALDVIQGLGVQRILTSGGAPTAQEGIPVLRRLVTRARTVSILACGTIGANVRKIVQETGAREVHMRAARLRTVVDQLTVGSTRTSTSMP